MSSIIKTPAFSSRIRVNPARSNIAWPSRSEGMKNAAFAADFVRVLANQRSDRGDHAAAFGAELFHGIDGGFHNAGQRAFPPRMNRADHTRVRIDQQYRPAVGGGDADGETFGARDDGV